MKRVYIAGPLRSKEFAETVKNMSTLMEVSEQVRLNGFSTYTPALDILMGIKFGDYNFSDYFDNSVEWLKASNALFLTGDWDMSAGCLKEIDIAEESGIPIFFDIPTMKEYFESKKNETVKCEENCKDCKCKKDSIDNPYEIETIIDGFLGTPKGSLFKLNVSNGTYENKFETETAKRSASFSSNLYARNSKFFKVIKN